jgi:putative oxidoreductase
MKTETLNPSVNLAKADWKPSSTRRFAELFFATPKDVTGLVLRLGLAVAMFPHGAQKALGWFGGYGMSGTLNAFTTYMHIPWLLALAVIAAEFLGAIALAFGFFTRLSALAIGATMAVAAAMVHLPHGFFMNWTGQQKGEGIEYFILAVAISVGLVLHGAGKWSVDSLIAKRVAGRVS